MLRGKKSDEAGLALIPETDLLVPLEEGIAGLVLHDVVKAILKHAFLVLCRQKFVSAVFSPSK